MGETEQCLGRIKEHKGIEAVIVVDQENNHVRPPKVPPGMDEELASEYAVAVRQLADKARDVVRCLDPQNDLCFLRLRSKRHEIMVAPHEKFLISVIQDPS